MSCRMACAVCVGPVELKKQDYNLAVTVPFASGAKEIRISSGGAVAPITRGDLLISISDTRTTPGPDYVLTRAVYQKAVEDHRAECCDKKKKTCQRTKHVFGSSVSLYIMHIEGPNCYEALLGAAAVVHFANLLEKMSTLAAQAKQTGNKEISLNINEKMVVQCSLSVTLTVQGSDQQARVEISKLNECAKSTKGYCCPNPSECRVGYCLSRDPIMYNSPDMKPIVSKAVISTTHVDLQCVGPWELKETDYEYAAKNFEGKESTVPGKGKPVSVLFRGSTALLLGSETERGAVVSQPEESQRIGELGLQCCNKKEGCQRGIYVFGEVKMQVRHFRAPICAKTSQFAPKDMEGLVEKAFGRVTDGLISHRLREKPGDGGEVVIEMEGSMRLTIQGPIGTANVDDMGVYVSAVSIQHYCCKGAGVCNGGDVEVVGTSSNTGAVGKVSINAIDVGLGKRQRRT
ncbi:unnamed protein product [Calypogeia fissa]